MDAAPDYSIVLPAHNEAELLPATLAMLREAMAGIRCRAR
jgi:glycosyltransferase involved in cell wall biosynthesis